MKPHSIISLACALGVAGCATPGVGPTADTNTASPSTSSAAAAPERFAYQPATDRTVRVTVDSVTLKGGKGFLPRDPNWLQVHLTVTNLSRQAITYSDVKAKREDGTVIAASISSFDVAKPPSVAKSVGTSMGIMGAGMMASYLLFPPAGLIAGGASVFVPMMDQNRASNTAEEIQRSALGPQVIAEGTSAAGIVFVPAVRGQTALIVFYNAGGSTRTLTVPRAS